MAREILFRGKRVIDGKWVESCCPLGEMHSGTVTYDFVQDTVCQYTGLTDKNDQKIFEGDICKLFDKCYNANLFGIVKFGKYNQDGSSNEYPPTPVIGFYVEIYKWEYTKESFYDNEEYPQWNRTISVLEAMDEKRYGEVEVIGNLNG